MNKVLFTLTCLFCLIVSLSGFWPSAAKKLAVTAYRQTAQTSAALPARDTNPPQDSFDRSADTIRTFELLISKAKSEGPVRVIVGLRVNDFQPEGKLAHSQMIEIQREAIAQVQDDLVERLSGLNVSSVRTFSFIPFTAMTVDAAALEQIKIFSEVVSIEEDLPIEPTLAQSVPLIGAPAAWAAGYTGSGQTVAILDTGVDKTHSFLAGKVVSEACYSSNTSNSSSVCPGGVTSSTSSGSGVPCASSISGCDHGTHVAGIAAGNGSSFSGVARDASLIAVQIFSRFDSTDVCKTTSTCVRTFGSDQLSGLERVFALRSSFSIASVNMSIGGGRFFSNCDTSNASLKAAIDNLRSVGIATVIASGNDGYKDSMGSPACISTAISVGATGDGSGGVSLDAVASFSNSVSFLSLLAPGNLITSSVPGGGFGDQQGTSMATPHVAGAWAVLKSKKPTATVDEVFAALRDTGLPVTDVNGIPKPRIKVDAAINAIGGSNNCSTTPIGLGQSLAGALTTTDCRYPTGTSWYSDAYSFNGTAGQQVAIAMSSSSFDTWIALIGPTGSQLAFDNDGGGGTNSRLPASGFFTLPSSGTFVIQASSNLMNATGGYVVSLISPPTGVPNNNFAGSQLISGAIGSVSGNNTGATKEAGEPNHAGNAGGASVWYMWQAPSNGSVTMTTAGSNFDTLLAVYTGSSVSALSSIVSNDDAGPSDLSSRVSFTAVSGTTYRIAIDGYNGATGNLVLNWNSLPVGPANNNFSSAQVISGTSGSVNGNNSSASKEAGEPNHAGDAGGVSVWYQWQAPASGTAIINTAGSNFDTLLAVYVGSSVAGLTGIVSNDDEAYPNVLTSRVSFSAVAGTTYRIAVDGFSGGTGNITLNWSLSSTGSIQLSQSSYTVNESSAFATITVSRTGSTAAPATVKYATSDATDVNFRCNPATGGQITGAASRKCDYHIAAGRLRFAAGESSKQIILSLVNDVYVEPTESLTITLSSPTGATLGAPSTATVVITDNDSAGQANPIDGTAFYVRMLYVDLLSREPDPNGFAGWVHRIDFCGQPGEPPPPCDRVTVGGDGFLRSAEFFDREFFVIRLYRTGLGRIPRYDDVGDLAFVSGFLTTGDLELNKQEVVADIMSRTEFGNIYNLLTNSQYVDRLIQTAAVTLPAGVRDGWVSALNGSTKTRAQVFRELSERSEVSAKYLHEAQVVSCYYGFFTRNPDGAYFNYLQRLDSGEINLGDLANAFINAAEYRQRFGP